MAQPCPPSTVHSNGRVHKRLRMNMNSQRTSIVVSTKSRLAGKHSIAAPKVLLTIFALGVCTSGAAPGTQPAAAPACPVYDMTAERVAV